MFFKSQPLVDYRGMFVSPTVATRADTDIARISSDNTRHFLAMNEIKLSSILYTTSIDIEAA
jgi:hypothetical protein